MNTEITTKNLPPEIEDMFAKMLELIQSQDKELSEIKKNKSLEKINEILPLFYFRIFQKFLSEVQSNNWIIERKYNTKSSANFIDIDFEKYTVFIRDNLEANEHRKFKEFLLDLNLIDPDTFNSKHGKIVTGNGRNRKRVFRVPKKSFFWCVQEPTDAAS